MSASNRGFRMYQNKEDKGTYSNLSFVGVGGQTGKEEIRKESLFGRLKTKRRIKMAIGITMYQEKWKEFQSTMTGVLQGILDLYLDQDHNSPNFLPWSTFKDQYLIVLIADGYNNLSEADFKKQAADKGFFDDNIIKNTYMKAVTEVDGKLKLQLRTMQEIRNSMKVKMETEDDPTIKDEEIIDNLLHVYQTELSMKELELKLEWTKEQEAKELEISRKFTSEVNKDRTVNFFFAIKQFNKGKIDSHLYFFRGFCKELNPDLCLMLDIGTEPKP